MLSDAFSILFVFGKQRSGLSIPLRKYSTLQKGGEKMLVLLWKVAQVIIMGLAMYWQR